MAKLTRIMQREHLLHTWSERTIRQVSIKCDKCLSFHLFILYPYWLILYVQGLLGTRGRAVCHGLLCCLVLTCASLFIVLILEK